MFRIRRIYDDSTPANRETLMQIRAILTTQFPGLSEVDINKLQDQLLDPVKYRFRSVVFVAEKGKSQICGFALLMHDVKLQFGYLDFISTGSLITGGGIGSALYERVREEALRLKVKGIFFECLPDDALLSPDPVVRKQNEARLRFYERYGALPIINTAYETPVQAGDTNPPYLVFDGLGKPAPTAELLRKVVRAILERKYGDTCDAKYINMVVKSIKDDPIKLRQPRHVVKPQKIETVRRPKERRIALIVNDKHDIHHVPDKGYVEAPVRISAISAELKRTDLFEEFAPRHFGQQHIKAVHDSGFVDFLRNACANVPTGKSVYPYVFPIRNHTRPPKELPLRAGYYCIDTFTPLNANAYLAASRAVDCALTAAEYLLEAYSVAYALVRPPGHHAERRSFGGFCYFNSAAIAAHYLSHYGKVVVLDIDYHHGNGTQDIFYHRNDVLTISLHGHPRYSYPYFSGYEDEKGIDAGSGFNLNIPLPENINGQRYRESLRIALSRIRRFNPGYVVLSLGLDTAKGDPTGSFTLSARDFELNGLLIGELKLPVLVVQEGGYLTRTLGVNARNFFSGLWRGVTSTRPSQNSKSTQR